MKSWVDNLRRPKHITKVIGDCSGVRVMNEYTNGRVCWFVRTMAKERSECRGCDLSRRIYCGNWCQFQTTDDAEAARGVHCRRVRKGDILSTVEGRKFKLVYEGATLVAIPFDEWERQQEEKWLSKSSNIIQIESK